MNSDFKVSTQKRSAQVALMLQATSALLAQVWDRYMGNMSANRFSLWICRLTHRLANYHSSFMNSAALSATAYTRDCMFARGNRGNTLASTTLTFSAP